jgi:hypothetical protein
MKLGGSQMTYLSVDGLQQLLESDQFLSLVALEFIKLRVALLSSMSARVLVGIHEFDYLK